jgi:hypothetical protein
MSSPDQDPQKPMVWACFQLDDGVEGCVPMVAVTIGTDHHAAFLNLPNFVVGVSGGIEILASIALREQPPGSRRLAVWEAELHRWGGDAIGRCVTFSGNDKGDFWGPQWQPREAMPPELLDAIGRTFIHLVAIGVLQQEEIAHGFA